MGLLRLVLGLRWRKAMGLGCMLDGIDLNLTPPSGQTVLVDPLWTFGA